MSASTCFQVVRDECLKSWKFVEENTIFGMELGSGYPSGKACNGVCPPPPPPNTHTHTHHTSQQTHHTLHDAPILCDSTCTD